MGLLGTGALAGSEDTGRRSLEAVRAPAVGCVTAAQERVLVEEGGSDHVCSGTACPPWPRRLGG